MGVADKVVRIGGGSAFLVDSALGVPQLLRGGRLHYLIFDYLAEASMGLLGRFQAVDPKGGYGADFLSVHVGPHLKEIARQGIKVIANAGGLNPRGLVAIEIGQAAHLLDIGRRVLRPAALEAFGLIGHHAGRSRLGKAAQMASRLRALRRWAREREFDLAPTSDRNDQPHVRIGFIAQRTQPFDPRAQGVAFSSQTLHRFLKFAPFQLVGQ